MALGVKRNEDEGAVYFRPVGGAVVTHVRVGGPIFNIVFAVIVGALLWGGLWLRDGQLREMLPLRARWRSV